MLSGLADLLTEYQYGSGCLSDGVLGAWMAKACGVSDFLDPEKVAIKMYDVDGPFGVGVRRATFLISQDRKIQDAMMADVRIGRHKEFIEKAVILRETAGLKSD